ncbi:MAG: formylmethanofuran dehydrogenase subunit E family protein [bacterium]
MTNVNEIPSDIQPIVDFHGGFDPGIVLGARLAQAALKAMNRRKGDKDLFVISENRRCHLDSIQWVTGCTIGGQKLIVKDFGKTALSLIDRNTGKGVRVSIKRGCPPEGFGARLNRGLSREEAREIVREMAFSLLSQDLDSYILIQKISLAGPVPPPPFPATERAICSVCGERVMDGLVSGPEGEKKCRNCAQESYYSVEEL